MRIDDLLDVDDTDYTSIELWGKTLYLGSLSAGDIYEYFDAVEAARNTPERRLSGIKLAVKCLVDGIPAMGVTRPARIGNDAAIEAFKKKNPKNVAMLVEKCLLLNGMGKKDALAQAKNVSGEAPLAASPTVLQ
jgi:hypothetical protein